MESYLQFIEGICLHHPVLVAKMTVCEFGNSALQEIELIQLNKKIVVSSWQLLFRLFLGKIVYFEPFEIFQARPRLPLSQSHGTD